MILNHKYSALILVQIWCNTHRFSVGVVLLWFIVSCRAVPWCRRLKIFGWQNGGSKPLPHVYGRFNFQKLCRSIDFCGSLWYNTTNR